MVWSTLKGCFRSADTRKLKQTAVCLLKCIDTTKAGCFVGVESLASGAIKRLLLQTSVRLIPL